MAQYRCPVCKKVLTKKEYESAMGILGERDKHFQHEKDELKKKLIEVRTMAKEAKTEGINIERKRTQRLLKGKDKTIQTLKERIDQIKKGTTPQTEGLEDEGKLTARLKLEFPSDDVQHKGKGGDVLHTVKYEKKPAGVIIYECKRTPKIQSQHITQAYQAKQTREADFAVLVTTGQRKNFTGFTQTGGVLVISPLGVIPLASLLRQHLIEMLKANITKEKRAAIAIELVKFISSPQFKNRIEDVVQRSSELQDMIIEEAKDHWKTWHKRWDQYQKISWDGSQIQNNLQLVLHGKEPQAILQTKIPPLLLPSSNDQ